MIWNEIEPGIWHTVIGSPEDLSPLRLMSVEPRHDALAAMPPTEFPLTAEDLAIERVGQRLVVRLPLNPEERIYGLGLQFKGVEHRGRTRYLRVNSDPKEDTGETHAPVPFYVSSDGYGVFVDTARIVTIHVASTVRRDSSLPPVLRDRGRDKDWIATPRSDQVEIVSVSPGFDLYAVAGPTPLDVVRRYNLLCGGGALPPRWGLGFWHRVGMFYDAKEAIAEAAQFREQRVPCDVIGLEPGWLSCSYPTSYEWDRERFPDPEAFVDDLRRSGFRVNLWENPYLSPRSRIYGRLTPYAGSHSVWNGLAIDYTIPEARSIIQEQHDDDHASIGVSGYKIDEVDGSELTGNSWMFPAHAIFPSGNDGEQLRQVFGLALQKMTTEVFRGRDKRTYGLVRGSGLGASSLPYVLYSDLYDHRDFVRALVNSSFCGLLWTPEIRHADNAEDWVRRMQVVCMSPMALLNAWSGRMLPWSFPEVADIVADVIRLRMRLMPYLYSAFARYHFDGTPPFRAMALEGAVSNHEKCADGRIADLRTHAYGQSAQHDVDDQWMMGDSILVAPLFAGENSRKVMLPSGYWFDFETGEAFQGGRPVDIVAPIDKLPLFVRDGGIVPLMPPLMHAPACGQAVPLEIRYYGSKPGRFELYDDDGETLAYERGEFRWRTIEAQLGTDGNIVGSIGEVDPQWQSGFAEISWTHLAQYPEA